MTTQTVIAAPGQRLSASQVRTFLECSAKWSFKYLEGLPEPPSASLTLGRSVHAALEHNFRQKVATGIDLPEEEVVEVYRERFRTLSEETEFRDDENPAELAESGASVLGIYHRQCSPAIQPAAVEQRLEGEIGGIAVVGVIDLVDNQDRIIDFKTASKRPSAVSPDQTFQLATYTALTGRTEAICRIDTLVKSKSPQVVQEHHRIDSDDIRYAALIYGLAQQAIQDGVYIPNRGSFLCSRKNCCYWRQCEKQFGGRVRE